MGAFLEMCESLSHDHTMEITAQTVLSDIIVARLVRLTCRYLSVCLKHTAPLLTTLDVSSSPIDEAEMRTIASHCPSLRNLKVQYAQESDISAMTSIAPQLETLEIISQSVSDVTADVYLQVCEFASALARCQTICAHTRARVAAALFVHAPAVRSIEIQSGGTFSTYIAKHIGVITSPYLDMVKLVGMWLYNNHPPNLFEHLVRICPKIRAMELVACRSFCEADAFDEYFGVLCSALHLTNIYLRLTDIDEDELKRVLPAVVINGQPRDIKVISSL